MNTPLPPLPEREQIALLEPFQGLGLQDIRVVATPQDAQDATKALLASGVVGFDTESKPTFAKFEVSGGPHVIQFATLHEAWLFQLHRTELHGELSALLASTDLTKVGFGLSSDLGLIRHASGRDQASTGCRQGAPKRREVTYSTTRRAQIRP